jgi:DNA polymerase
MADAMLRMEQGGVYRPVLSVHDELIAEADEGTGDVHEFESIMATVPEWASGCPVVAEGWTGTRYHK